MRMEVNTKAKKPDMVLGPIASFYRSVSIKTIDGFLMAHGCMCMHIYPRIT